MKKLFLLVGLILFLTACGGGAKEEAPAENTAVEEQEAAEKTEETAEEKEEVKPAEEKNLTIDDTWEVPGLWKVKINSIKATDDRNEFEERQPAQVFVLNYTYENLGYEGDSMDLYIIPDRYMDDSRKMGYDYPGDRTLYPEELPIGGVVDAEAVFGVDNETKTVKIFFEQYDDDNNNHEVIFEIPVE